MYRCTTSTCKKKTYAIMKCRCGSIYCGLHLGDHECTHDYRAEHRETLAKLNPKVVGAKMTYVEDADSKPQ